jgi:hypothetical protein
MKEQEEHKIHMETERFVEGGTQRYMSRKEKSVVR